MKNSMFRSSCAVILLLCAWTAVAQSPESRVVVYSANKIVTMDDDQPTGRFVAVHDGRILGVADRLEGLTPLIGDRETIVDTQFVDRILMPGFIDPHLHPIMAAVLLPTTFITPEDWELPTQLVAGVTSPDGYRDKLAQEVAASDDAVIITWGYHQLWHGPLDRKDLDAIESDRPVIVWHRSFHEIVVNSAAMTYLGFPDASTFASALSQPGVDPSHANYEAGHISETALALAFPALQRIVFTPEHLQTGMAMLRTMMLKAGVTTIADMATGIFAPFEMESAIIRNSFERDDSPARVVLVPTMSQMIARKGSLDAAISYLRDAQTAAQGHRVFLNNRVKVFADGAFFSQYMRMNPPGYDDGHEGKWLTVPSELDRITRALWAAGFTIHCHVNGDEGLDVVLDILEAAQAETPRTDHRFTLEHVGYSSPAQSERVAALGALVSAQPNYLFVLSRQYSEHGLGPERASQMSRLGSFEKQGVRIALHSDLTMAPVDPLFLAWIAANRINMEGETMAPDERLSLDKALRAITIDAAYVLGLESEIGSISAGKRADFAVVDRDPYEAGAAALKDIQVHGVVFEGVPYPLNQGGGVRN